MECQPLVNQSFYFEINVIPYRIAVTGRMEQQSLVNFKISDVLPFPSKLELGLQCTLKQDKIVKNTQQWIEV